MVLKTSWPLVPLKGTENPYRIFVEKMYEGAATLAPEKTFLYSNERLARMLRTPLEKLIGSSIIDFIRPENVKEFELFFEKGMRGASRGEFTLLAANGDAVAVYLSISCIKMDGELRVCLLATDMREQKLLEQSRTEVDLQEIERGLREQFISALSHDLLNPLTAAKIAAERSLQFDGNAEMRGKLTTKAIEGIDRVDRMIRDFLDATRIRAGAPLPLNISEFDLQDMLTKVISELKPIHGDRFVLQPSAPTRGFWDFDALRRAVENLITNGIKYGSPNSPVVIKLVRENDYSVQISVHNQGNYITQSAQTALFSGFSTMKIAATGQRGWGIGLVLVRGVAQAHGGTLSVESGPEKGTNFYIQIPRDARAFQIKAA